MNMNLENECQLNCVEAAVYMVIFNLDFIVQPTCI